MTEPALPKTCFVSMPFGVKTDRESGRSIDFETIYQLIVQPAAQDAGYAPMRADSAHSGSIVEETIRAAIESELFIGDLTLSNPNVLYEIGVRHAAQKPILLIAQSGAAVPFDLARIRILIYDDQPDHIETSRQILRDLIRKLEREGQHVGSPVSAYLAAKSLSESPKHDASTSTPVESTAILDVLSGINTRLQDIEAKVSAISTNDDDLRTQTHLRQKNREPASRRIFIVHGRSEAADSLRNQMVTFLSKLEFEPIVLSDQAEGGRALPNKLDEEMSDVEFAFVLLTPDDVGAHKSESDSLQPRARQNVIYEHGLFAGRLGLSRVCLVQFGKLEIPSDLAGIIPKKLNEGEQLRRIQYELISELRQAGYTLDANLVS